MAVSSTPNVPGTYYLVRDGHTLKIVQIRAGHETCFCIEYLHLIVGSASTEAELYQRYQHLLKSAVSL